MSDFTGLELTGKVAKVIEASGTKAIVCQADVSKLNEIPKLVEVALKVSTSRKIKILIHRARIIFTPTNACPIIHFDANVKGSVFLIKAIVPRLRKGGRIVFISPAGARLSVAGYTVYTATKAANELVACVSAKELGHPHSATASSVNPHEQFLKNMQLYHRPPSEPLIDSTLAAPRVREVDGIAPLVSFLCTDNVRWAPGSTLSANGGLYN
ncbi:hypothetical protein F4805DRAFT_471142 [Annulohypoxylon moriforme]|nr:hypothetical protein F4805DRAFT_471142 [Annulohypoxylon moriforme]